jgi:sirohydrochlorin cobaltochelatase
VTRVRPPFGIPLPTVRRPAAAATWSPEALLLVGHGSRCPVNWAEMAELARSVDAALPGVAVDVGYLEMTDPPAGVILDRMVAAGARRVVVLPVVLLAAGHAKSDVPAVVLEARDRHPGVDIRFGAPFGVARDLVAVLGGAVEDVGGTGLPLLLVARGTSDPDANGDAHKASRLLAEWTGAPFSHVAFSGVTTPCVVDGLDVFARLGFERVVVAWWFLCHGRLIERGRADIAAFAAGTGVSVLDAGHIGPDPSIVSLVVEGYRAALAVSPRPNCDLCSYRAPWPGLADRVGQPVGVGHSHLAVNHRHHGS